MSVEGSVLTYVEHLQTALRSERVRSQPTAFLESEKAKPDSLGNETSYGYYADAETLEQRVALAFGCAHGGPSADPMMPAMITDHFYRFHQEDVAEFLVGNVERGEMPGARTCDEYIGHGKYSLCALRGDS